MKALQAPAQCDLTLLAATSDTAVCNTVIKKRKKNGRFKVEEGKRKSNRK